MVDLALDVCTPFAGMGWPSERFSVVYFVPQKADFLSHFQEEFLERDSDQALEESVKTVMENSSICLPKPTSKKLRKIC